MKDRNDKKGKQGLGRILNAFRYSCSGFASAWLDEAAFRQVLGFGLVFIILALYFGDGFVEKILLILPCFLCIIVELINSAIENAVDFTSTKIHPLAKKAKDMGSAAQLVCIALFFIIWGDFILEKILR